MDEASNESESFKAPSLPSTAAQPKDIDNDNKTISKASHKDKVVKKNLVNVPLPYQEPEWGGLPPSDFSFEVIKNGTFVTNTPIKSSFFVFGRLEVCDVVFEHPSVSRYHAIVQYCPGDEHHPKGFYLYDLGSTHGTFLNKKQIKAKVYYKLKVGYILKFGGSSRLHIFQGPEEEDEPEEQKKEAEEEQETCNWGIDDDEDVEEEDENAVNPFALCTPNEELYLEDPKKTLRGWFEREGYELEFKVEEKGFKSFSCTIQLPVDTLTGEYLPVEASVSGKKKEAVIACCLEACRTLDRLGLLRQSQQESRERKRKKWEDNDYYDSDEDTFYDRTGEIEKRREMRKKLANKKPAVENFESLSSKLNELTSEIEEINKKLDACSKKKKDGDDSGEADSLESFMSSLAETANAPTDKFQRRKLMLRLSEAEKEKAHVERLLNIARPALLPSITKYPGMVGKKPRSKFQVPVTKPKVVAPSKADDVVVEEEEESDAENKADKPVEAPKDVPAASEKMEIDDEDGVKTKSYGLIFPSRDIEGEVKEKSAPVKVSPEHSKDSGASPSVDVDEIKVSETPKKENDAPPKPKQFKKSKHKKQEEVDVYKKESAEYSTWTPPVNQSGDGITHLNAKYGY